MNNFVWIHAEGVIEADPSTTNTKSTGRKRQVVHRAQHVSRSEGSMSSTEHPGADTFRN